MKGLHEESLRNLKGGCKTENRLRDGSRGLRAETKKAHVVKIYWSNFFGASPNFRRFTLI